MQERINERLGLKPLKDILRVHGNSEKGKFGSWKSLTTVA